MKYRDIVNTVAEELSLPKEVVDKAYKAYWEFIRVSIEALPLKEDLSQEDFKNLRTSINIPSLGKLSCTYSRYLGIKNRFKCINKIRKKQ